MKSVGNKHRATYATAGTRDGITEMINRFYCGQGYSVTSDGQVLKPSGGRCPGVAVELKRGQYRFVGISE